MIAEVEALAADERGVLLALLQGDAVDGAACLAGSGAERCRAALAAVAALSDAARAAERAALVAELAADVPAGLENVHPGWIRRALEGEPGAVVLAAVEGLPAEIGRVADEILRGRGDARAHDRPVAGPGLASLRRTLFAALAPMPTDGNGGPPLARALCALSFAALLEELDRRGAAALGVALAGAPDAVVARAAAGVGPSLAGVVLAAAKGGASPDERARARALVADVPPDEAARGVARAVGLRAVARALAAEGAASLAAVAQRLPPAVGGALLACAPGAEAG